MWKDLPAVDEPPESLVTNGTDLSTAVNNCEKEREKGREIAFDPFTSKT